MTYYTKNIKRLITDDGDFKILDLPNSNYFSIKITSDIGSALERCYSRDGFNIYGIMHLCEHLALKTNNKYSSNEMINRCKNLLNYNAMTDFDIIEYWFGDVSDEYNNVIDIALLVALNDFSKISQDEYNLERNIVYNEIKAFNGESTDLFSRQTVRNYFDLEEFDDISGDVDNINNFTLEQCQHLKSIMLAESHYTIEISYDSTKININDLISVIDKKVNKNITLSKIKNQNNETIKIRKLYDNKNQLTLTNESYKTIDVKSDTVYIDVLFNIGNEFSPILRNLLTLYLSDFTDNSIHSVLRYDNGLVYSSDLGYISVGNKYYLNFSCITSSDDISNIVMLVKGSILECLQNINPEIYKEFCKKTQKQLSYEHLDLKNYFNYLTLFTKDIKLDKVLGSDIDKLDVEQLVSYKDFVNALTKVSLSKEIVLGNI